MSEITSNNNILGEYILLLLLSLPLLSCCYVILRVQSNIKIRIISSAFLSAMIFRTIPKSLCALGITIIMIIFGLCDRFPMNNKSTQRKENSKNFETRNQTFHETRIKAVKATLLLATIMFTENFCIWVVSATYKISHVSSPTPLQDNGKILIHTLFYEMLKVTPEKLQEVRNFLNIPWALVLSLCGSIIICEFNLSRRYKNLGTLACKALLTLGTSRFIRTLSFLMTVLPSQLPFCYRKHKFPVPPPSSWIDWILIGLIPNSKGGCNDLIISGHATVMSVLALACTSVAEDLYFTIAVWMLLTFDFLVEISQGFHYSVDMWLGAVITTLVWHLMKFLDEDNSIQKQKSFTSLKVLLMSNTSISDALSYAFPAFMAFIVVAFIPESIANYCIILFLVLAVGVIVRNNGYITPFGQHIFLLVTFITFAIYL